MPIPCYDGGMRRVARTLAACLALTWAPSCTTPGELVAPDGTHRLQATDPTSGVTMVMTTEVWDGEDDINGQYTVVHVLVANMGNTPVRLAPGDFELTDRRGFRYPLNDMGHSFTVAEPGAQSVRVSANYATGNDPRYRTGYASRDLSEAALPWGTLLPGTTMRGFLFFDRMNETANGGTFRWYAATDRAQAIANFEFQVAVARPRRR